MWGWRSAEAGFWRCLAQSAEKEGSGRVGEPAALRPCLPHCLWTDGRTDERAISRLCTFLLWLCSVRVHHSEDPHGCPALPCPPSALAALLFLRDVFPPKQIKKGPRGKPKARKREGERVPPKPCRHFSPLAPQTFVFPLFFLFPFHSSSCGEFLITTGLPRS